MASFSPETDAAASCSQTSIKGICYDAQESKQTGLFIQQLPQQPRGGTETPYQTRKPAHCDLFLGLSLPVHSDLLYHSPAPHLFGSGTAEPDQVPHPHPGHHQQRGVLRGGQHLVCRHLPLPGAVFEAGNRRHRPVRRQNLPGGGRCEAGG